MILYSSRLENGINFALEPEWFGRTYIRMCPCLGFYRTLFFFFCSFTIKNTITKRYYSFRLLKIKCFFLFSYIRNFLSRFSAIVLISYNSSLISLFCSSFANIFSLGSAYCCFGDSGILKL